MANGEIGVIYLLHFDAPYKHARHYLGFCTKYEGLDSRFEYHASGRGSRLLRAVASAGIKNTGACTRYCPVCKSRPWTPRRLEELTV